MDVLSGDPDPGSYMLFPEVTQLQFDEIFIPAMRNSVIDQDYISLLVSPNNVTNVDTIINTLLPHIDRYTDIHFMICRVGTGEFIARFPCDDE
nr:hypothetical protein [Elizabethkingia sp. ASV34]